MQCITMKTEVLMLRKGHFVCALLGERELESTQLLKKCVIVPVSIRKCKIMPE